MAFRFDGVLFFLTYPQSGELEWQTIIDHLESIKPLSWARVCKESHEDGSPHHHVVGKFSGRVKSSNVRLFDVAGKHPNVQPVRSVAASLKYVTKDGEFHDIGTVPEGRSNFDCVAAAKTLGEAEYYQACLAARVPFQYAAKFLDLQKAKGVTTITDDYVPDMLRETLELQSVPFISNKTNIVIGPTGHGKTQWAKRIAPKPALWVRHIDVLRSFRIGYHQSIIFDDVVFSHYPREAQIHISDCQDEAHIHVRYGVAVIPAGIPRVFTANRRVFIQDDAIDRRCVVTMLIGHDPVG